MQTVHSFTLFLLSEQKADKAPILKLGKAVKHVWITPGLSTLLVHACAGFLLVHKLEKISCEVFLC